MKNHADKPICIECRWCGVRVDFDSGSNFACSKEEKSLTALEFLHKPGCRHFKLQSEPARRKSV